MEKKMYISPLVEVEGISVKGAVLVDFLSPEPVPPIGPAPAHRAPGFPGYTPKR